MEIDFLAIGDITTDAFIRLKDASVHCDINNEDCQLCMTFGDKIPYDFVEVVKGVGNSANAAVAASRLGLKAGLMANIGGDAIGADCLSALKENGVSTDQMTIEKEKKSNYHYVLWYESDRTILVKHEEYAYALPSSLLTVKKAPKWIYLSSIGSNSLDFHMKLVDYLKAHPEVKVAFQPGTYQMQFGTAKLAELYRRTDIFICNVEEAERILNIKNAHEGDRETQVKELLVAMSALGPKLVLITDGPKGAYALDTKGGTAASEMYFMPIYPDRNPPYERTGAGDAFASTFVASVILGKSLKEALAWAPISSMSVVQYIGAQKGLLTRPTLEKFLSEAPADYKPQAI